MKPPTRPPVPQACLLRKAGSPNETYCGREVWNGSEHLFLDPDHAMSHYRGGKFLRLCEDCAEICELKGGHRATDKPYATRGLDEKNDK